jgi:aminoglycoside/choline kinase family phosphotransferase
MQVTPAKQRAWLRGQYEAVELTPEASARRYARSEHPDTRGWLRVRSLTPAPIAITKFLLEIGVRVPRLGPAIDGVYLVEDLGDVHLSHRPEPENYAALLAVHRRYFLAELPVGHPNRALALDVLLFRRELRMFADTALTCTHGQQEPLPLHLEPLSQTRIRAALDTLAALAVEGPQALAHRDLHCRNVLLHRGEVVLIDHQDMRRGPLFYDLASLHTDAYLDLAQPVMDQLEGEVLRLGDAAGLDQAASLRQWRRTALQRVLKALGTFAKLQAHGRADYAPAEQRARAHARRLFHEILDHDPSTSRSLAALATLPFLQA